MVWRLQLALSDSQHFPAVFTEPARNLPVALFVSGDFPPPIILRRFRGAVAARATMPKAAVNKQGDAGFWERKVGTPQNRQMPTPAGDSVLPQDFQGFKLRAGVAASADFCHDFRPLALSNGVHNQA